MNANNGARDARAQPQPLCCERNCTDDAPDERAVPLSTDPRMVVIRNHGKREAHLFGPLRVAHEAVWQMFFAGKSAIIFYPLVS